MAVIERGAVPAPTLPKRTVPLPELGAADAEVIVRGLLLVELPEQLFVVAEARHLNAGAAQA